MKYSKEDYLDDVKRMDRMMSEGRRQADRFSGNYVTGIDPYGPTGIDSLTGLPYLNDEAKMAFLKGTSYTPGYNEVEAVDVAVIHKDFRGVADRLLEEAKLIINKAKPDDRVNRYKKLGFGGITRVKEHDQAHKEKAEREKLLHLINDYKVKYPLCQFIDSSSLEELCKKYGLVYAPAEYFNQEIPEENLKEIEAFKLKKEDHVKQYWTFRTVNELRTVYTEKETDGMWGVIRHQNSAGFNVVATKDMFDVPQGFKFSGSTLRAQVKDPIVLMLVPKGFLIVTAWGPEAELPELNTDKQ